MVLCRRTTEKGIAMAYQMICDLCGKPIETTEYSQFKIKKRVFSFYESWWEKIEVHDKCVEALWKATQERKGESK